MARLVEHRVRKALEPVIAEAVAVLVEQMSVEGITAAATSNVAALVLGAQLQESIDAMRMDEAESLEDHQEAVGATETAFEPEDSTQDVVDVPEAEGAENPSVYAEPDAAEKRAALADLLRRQEPEPAAPAQDFASIFLAARGAR